MKIKNEITELFGIEFPIIQGGMVWVSGWRLASAVSENGGLGLIGAGSMKPELLREHIRKCAAATKKPFGVNLPLLRKDAQDLVDVILEEKVKIVFTSAGHPGKFIEQFKTNGLKVAHVVSNLKQALKTESVGCDAVVAEGVEAGGHNGTDEITTMALIPHISENVKIPVIAAGGISSGKAILAAFALGAKGVQIGTLFAATTESSAHENYKRAILNARDTDTTLILKQIALARVIKNKFAEEAVKAEYAGVGVETLKKILGEKRERRGIFEGDLEEGMLEAGQGAAQINKEFTVGEVFEFLISDYDKQLKKLTETNANGDRNV